MARLRVRIVGGSLAVLFVAENLSSKRSAPFTKNACRSAPHGRRLGEMLTAKASTET
jgi:hypothetical protein